MEVDLELDDEIRKVLEIGTDEQLVLFEHCLSKPNISLVHNEEVIGETFNILMCKCNARLGVSLAEPPCFVLERSKVTGFLESPPRVLERGSSSVESLVSEIAREAVLPEDVRLDGANGVGSEDDEAAFAEKPPL